MMRLARVQQRRSGTQRRPGVGADGPAVEVVQHRPPTEATKAHLLSAAPRHPRTPVCLGHTAWMAGPLCLRARHFFNPLARQMVQDDALSNHFRRVLEQGCLITLAAYKPAGEDLRSIGACLTLVSELERIGDYAADLVASGRDEQLH
jgi:hypothetical protein